MTDCNTKFYPQHKKDDKITPASGGDFIVSI